MSVRNVQNQIAKFLRSPTAEVLCIRGNWGTGKTYTWMEALKEAAKPEGGLAMGKYAYVSLFGQNSLEDVKREVFYQTINRDRIGKPFDAKDVSALFSSLPQVANIGSRLVGAVFGDGYSDLGSAVMYLTVRNRLICIDDLERKGEDLRSADVLGLISQLKDDRNCKVVLLLNDEQLEDRDEFETFLEKVVDVSLRFAPTPAESAETAFKGQTASPLVKEELTARTIALGIDNVRVIRKILRIINELEPLLKAYKPGVMRSVIGSLTLVGWSYLERDSSPPLDYIRQLGEYSSIIDGPTPELAALKKQWGPLLQRYGYNLTDEFDEVLIQGVIDGYFDPDIVAMYAKQLHDREESSDANAELDKAWAVFHGSFADNVDEMVAIVVDCFNRNARFFSFSTTTQLIDLLRRIDQVDASNQVFEAYVNANEGNPGAFDMERLLRFGHELPPDIVERIKEMEAKAEPDLTNDERFLKLKEAGFDSEIGLELAKAPVAEYIRVLTSHTGEELKIIRYGLTDYIDVTNPPDVAQAIMHKAAEALLEIAKRSPFDRARAYSYRLIQWHEKWKRMADPAEPVELADAAPPAEAPVGAKPRRPRNAKPA